MKKLLFILLVGCGDNIKLAPDALMPDTKPDIPPSVGVRPDAAVDATEEPVCWKYVIILCNGENYQLCVPYHGCSNIVCDGVPVGYCGPG